MKRRPSRLLLLLLVLVLLLVLLLTVTQDGSSSSLPFSLSVLSLCYLTSALVDIGTTEDERLAMAHDVSEQGREAERTAAAAAGIATMGKGVVMAASPIQSTVS